MIQQLIIATVVLLGTNVFMFAIAKDDIINQLKLKLRKGMGKLVFVGNDNSLRTIVKKVSLKKDDTTVVKVRGLVYILNPKKILHSEKIPTWLYKEGNPEPLDPNEIHIIKGIDNETFTSLLAKARLSGQTPNQGLSGKEQLIQTITMVGAGASVVAVMLLMRMNGLA